MGNSLLFGQVFFSCLCYFGLFPVQKDDKFIIKRRYVIYNRIVIALILFLQYIYVYANDSHANVSTFTYIGIILIFYGFIASVFICVLCIHCKRIEICYVLNEIQECWENWKQSMNIIGKNRWFILFYRCNSVILQISTLILILLRLLGNPNPYYKNSAFLIDILMSQIFAACDNFFLLLTINGYFLFSWLNESFSNWCEIVLKSNKSDDDNFAKTLRVYYYDRYSKILEILFNINSSFSAVNFVFFAYCSCTVIMMSVLLMVGIIPGNKGETSTLTEYVFFIYFYSNKSLVCLYVVSLVREEMDHALLLVHRISVKNDNEKVKEELEILYLLLIHRSFSFDACGLFKIDYSLLLSMLGTTVTYILILIQSEHGHRSDIAAHPILYI